MPDSVDSLEEELLNFFSTDEVAEIRQYAFDTLTRELDITPAEGTVTVPQLASNPSTPASVNMHIFAKRYRDFA